MLTQELATQPKTLANVSAISGDLILSATAGLHKAADITNFRQSPWDPRSPRARRNPLGSIWSRSGVDLGSTLG